jgi:predicted DNA-binding protein with PD1-like motif
MSARWPPSATPVSPSLPGSPHRPIVRLRLAPRHARNAGEPIGGFGVHLSGGGVGSYGDASMRSKLINDAAQKTYALILDTGDEVMTCLAGFAEREHLAASQFTAIGAFSDAVLGFFDLREKDYRPIPVHDQVEVLSLVGDVAVEDGRPKVHAHVVIGDRQGHTRGGHLLRAHVRPTLEIIITESPAHLHRRHDPETGLSLIRFA